MVRSLAYRTFQLRAGPRVSERPSGLRRFASWEQLGNPKQIFGSEEVGGYVYSDSKLELILNPIFLSSNFSPSEDFSKILFEIFDKFRC